MHFTRKVTEDLTWIGADDRRLACFEGVYGVPEGVSYNSYLLQDEKTVLFDTVDKAVYQVFFENLKAALGGRKLDYLVISHMEPDHSSLIAVLQNIWPEVKLIGNAKTVPMLKGYHGINEDIITVKDGDTLDLGGHVLSFATVPMLHWPESMVTFDTTTGVLFSNDSFGGFGAHEGGLFDDEKISARWASEMLRYYACIVAKYSNVVQVALKKLAGLEITNIFPSHGTLFRKDIKQVISLYDKWSRHEGESGAVVVYGSMYGNTKRMAEAVCSGLAAAKVKDVRIYDSSRADMSSMLRDIWRFKGLALLSCTYNTVLYPPMDALCSKLLNRMPKNKVLGIAGSYSWSKGALTALQSFAEKIKLDKIEPEVEVYTAPTEEDLEKCFELGKNLGEAIS
mgnify:CR=1 FL=1